tara:strand:+ start:372 stop:881 length:510 start_codon:yes stop_codon:yes gene_type:complete
MKLGKKISLFYVIYLILLGNLSIAEDKIITTPLINLNEIKPSFEDPETINENLNTNKTIQNKKKQPLQSNTPHAVLIGLDKITAKSSKLIVNLDEVQNFGPLEIRILKCGKVNINNKVDDVAYMQVKDLTKGENEKVFIFNGWTFSSDPYLTPFDHAIYDLQLVNCYNA